MDAVREDLTELRLKYTGLLQSIEIPKEEIDLAQSIWTWIILARRSLTLKELRSAVELDLGNELDLGTKHLSLRKAIPRFCKDLVTIDNNRVNVVHEEIRHILLEPQTSLDFAVNWAQGHTRISIALLKLLSGDCLRQLPINSSAEAASASASNSSLLGYAAKRFSTHISRCSSEENSVMKELCAFLESNGLLWIEHVARRGGLRVISRTARNLSYYSTLREIANPTDGSITIVKQWATELRQVEKEFSSQLRATLGSIRRLIPALCPPESMIFNSSTKHFGLRPHGLFETNWEDYMVRLDLSGSSATAVGSGDVFYAVGTSTGSVMLYSSESGERCLTVAHPGRVELLQFSPGDEHLASCSADAMIIWNTESGAPLCEIALTSFLLGVTFVDRDEVVAAYSDGQVLRWNITIPQPSSLYRHTKVRVSLIEYSPRWQSPTCVAFLVTRDATLVALGDRMNSVLIWNIREQNELGQCNIRSNNGINDMVFNPNPDIPSLAAACTDGRLCLFDYSTTALKLTVDDMDAQTLAWSSDGYTLFTGSSRGVVKVFGYGYDQDGNTRLIPIYQVDGPEDSIRGIAFSSHGLRILGLGSQDCHVWDHAALVRKQHEHERSCDARLCRRMMPPAC